MDRLLFQAANRGVQINIIVYKEVTQALTLSSSHTKHWLEDNDNTGNIKVFRHPDHIPDKKMLASNIWAGIKETGMSASKLSKLPGDALKGVYGMNEDTILYWAHHEKLCVVDGGIAFMGGLDLCYGRWDTNQHSISDTHPGDLNRIVFPGQDYNNARIMDFQDVQHWQNNKLDRTANSRMGWSDISISLHGPIVEDLRAHFAQRWNLIYFEVREMFRNGQALGKEHAARLFNCHGEEMGCPFFDPPLYLVLVMLTHIRNTMSVGTSDTNPSITVQTAPESSVTLTEQPDPEVPSKAKVKTTTSVNACISFMNRVANAWKMGANRSVRECVTSRKISQPVLWAAPRFSSCAPARSGVMA